MNLFTRISSPLSNVSDMDCPTTLVRNPIKYTNVKAMTRVIKISTVQLKISFTMVMFTFFFLLPKFSPLRLLLTFAFLCSIVCIQIHVIDYHKARLRAIRESDLFQFQNQCPLTPLNLPVNRRLNKYPNYQITMISLTAHTGGKCNKSVIFPDLHILPDM